MTVWLVIAFVGVACAHQLNSAADSGGLDAATIEQQRKKNESGFVQRRTTTSLGQTDANYAVTSKDAAGTATQGDAQVDSAFDEYGGEDYAPEFESAGEGAMDMEAEEEAPPVEDEE
ncbi:MAG: hypothetical protein JXR45_10365 [Deltaproteobacteria bacterium]|nr:hypothetical protein [Deltaproteobacteria bacterium]